MHFLKVGYMQYYLNMKCQTYKFVLNNVSEPSVLCNYRDALIIRWGNAYYCLKEDKNLVAYKNPAVALPKTYQYAPRNRSSPGVLQSLPPCVSGRKTSDANSLKLITNTVCFTYKISVKTRPVESYSGIVA